MAKLAEGLLREPVRVEVAPTVSAAKIEQRLHHADDLEHKRQLLNHFINLPEVEKAIVFTATKRDADTLARDLWQAGHAAGALHGDMNQGQRNRTIEQLRTGRIRLLVATDVAARGIDIKDVTHVINFDLPRQPEDYVHRIGRTGRAGAEGVAISFAGRVDREALFRIERYTKSTMEVHVVPGLEPRRPISTAPAGRPNGPKRGFRPDGANSGNKWGRSAHPQGGRPAHGGRSDHMGAKGAGAKTAARVGK
jgi:superfamily II DNA/RNA helicase